MSLECKQRCMVKGCGASSKEDGHDYSSADDGNWGRQTSCHLSSPCPHPVTLHAPTLVSDSRSSLSSVHLLHQCTHHTHLVPPPSWLGGEGDSHKLKGGQTGTANFWRGFPRYCKIPESCTGITCHTGGWRKWTWCTSSPASPPTRRAMASFGALAVHLNDDSIRRSTHPLQENTCQSLSVGDSSPPHSTHYGEGRLEWFARSSVINHAPASISIWEVQRYMWMRGQWRDLKTSMAGLALRFPTQLHRLQPTMDTFISGLHCQGHQGTEEGSPCLLQ